MLLQLENTNKENILKLIDFAGKLNLHLSLVDESLNGNSLPGKPLNEAQLKIMIDESRLSGIISMKQAHLLIRKNFDTD